ncbi:MAG: transglutaminase family protein [Planctomycetia bacterium]
MPIYTVSGQRADRNQQSLRTVLRRAFLALPLMFGCWIPTSVQADENLKQAETETTLSAEVLAEQARKSLVVVRSTDRTGGELGLGTGFAIEGPGLIATAYHVIGDGREIRVELPDGRKLPVIEVFASSSQLDLAILRVEATDLPPLPLSPEGKTPQGREIVALGHPEGFRNAIVTGVVSGYQEIDGIEMLQLAMSIERGNSGGPVLDRKGQVVGIVTRKSALQDKLGFALPVRLLRDMQADPNPVPMTRWSTIGALDEKQWTPLFGGNWRQRAGRILVNGQGNAFGGRTLCIHQPNPPELPYDVRVMVKLGSEEGAAGLVFHSDGNERHYGFYPSAGNLRLTLFDGSDVNSWTILHNQPHEAYRLDDWNTLTVRIHSDRFECFVNGTRVVESKDSTLRSGRIGLAAFRGTVAEFRRFETGRDLLPTTPTAENFDRLRQFADSVPWKAPVQQPQLNEILPLGETAVDFMTAESLRLEQKARQLKTLARDLYETGVRQELLKELNRSTTTDASPDAVAGNPVAEPGLLKCALLIARIDNPDVDVTLYLDRVNAMVDDLKKTLPADASEAVRIARLDQWLFEEMGVRGSRYEYESPSNSYMNEVIDDREGIPISLSVLYMELAARLQLNVVGVGLPGHFVVRFEPTTAGTTPETIDVFERGRRLSEDEIQRILAEAGFPNEPRFREARSTRQILERMLTNLLSLAESQRRDPDVLSCLETLALIDPNNVEYRAKRLEMRARTGRLHMAIEDASWFISEQPAGVDVERVRELRQSLEMQLERQKSIP